MRLDLLQLIPIHILNLLHILLVYLPGLQQLLLHNTPLRLAHGRHVNILPAFLLLHDYFLAGVVLLIVFPHKLLELELVVLLPFVHFLSFGVCLLQGFDVFPELIGLVL